MNYAHNYDLFFPFFIKVVVNKSKAYSFLIIGIMHLQKILLSVIMLRFYFFTAKQGTWVHNFDRGPLYLKAHIGWNYDLEIAGASPLLATIFLPTIFACLHTSLQEETLN